MREFGVSVITVRRALRDLEMEGLIIGHQGLGGAQQRQLILDASHELLATLIQYNDARNPVETAFANTIDSAQGTAGARPIGL